MAKNLFHRSIAFSLAAMLTLAMLGGIDHLAQTEPQPAQWAQHSTPRA